MKIVLYILIAFFFVFLAYECRYYILYFLDVVKISRKNQKGIKDLQKEGMNLRCLTNEELDHYIGLSKELLSRNNLWPKSKEYKIDIELERHLKYSRFSEKYVLELFHNILDYLGLNKDKAILEINYISSKYFVKYVGTYIDKNNNQDSTEKKVIINIQNDYPLEKVVAILAHESTHYLLLSNGIKLKDTKQNECLTDVTAVLLGFGKYMELGYKISNKVIYDEVNHRSIKKDRVGYISYKDIRYVLRHKK